MSNRASMQRASGHGLAPVAKRLAAGLDFCHTELSPESGWSAPASAALARSLIEPGLPPARAAEARRRLRHRGLEPYEGRSPELVEAVAAQLAKASGALQA